MKLHISAVHFSVSMQRVKYQKELTHLLELVNSTGFQGGTFRQPAIELAPNLWIGKRDESNFLTETGITHVLHCEGGNESVARCLPSFYRKLGIAFQSLPLIDFCKSEDSDEEREVGLKEEPDLLSVLEEAITFIDDGRTWGRVFVCCLKGRTLSPVLGMMYLMQRYGWTATEVYLQMVVRRKVRLTANLASQMILLQSDLEHRKLVKAKKAKNRAKKN